MNKIYKVVWNKARNCYVVVSEFAKNHQTGSSRIKAASVAAVMAATMLTIGTGVIYAANVTDTDEKEPKETILFDNKQNETTKLNDPNLTHHNPDYPSVHGHTDRCGELTYNTTLTIGDINKVADALVANDKLLYNQGIKNVTMNNGTISLIRNDNSRVTDSIALTGNDGKNGQDTEVTVTVGNKSQKFQTGSVVTAKTDTSGKATGLTINGKSYDIKAGKTYKAGENVTIADDGTISATDTTYSAGKNVKIDDKNKISVDLSEYAKSDDVAVVYQDNDKNKSLHSTNAGTVGSSSIALGKEATTGSRSVALGDQTKATGQSSTAIGTSSQATAENAVALGGAAKANVYGGVALGTSSVADRAAEAGVVGAFASEGADGLTWKANAGAVSVGSDTITRQITNVAAGSEATDAVNVAQLKAATENAGWNLSTEKKITQPTKVKSGAIVDFSGDDENITISKEETDFATFVKVNLNRNLNVDSVQAGDFFMNNEKGIGFGGNAYITKDGLNANDKVITNVAEGVYNTDAVNVGQLKKVEEVAANANKGWNLSTNGVATEATNVAPGEYVDFSGDKNISVSNDKTKVKVELNKDLVDIESISNGDAKLTLGGLATELTNGQGASVKLFGDATIINGKVNVYNDGRIAGVAAGINDNDAVNVGQLKNSAWKLAANGVLTEAEDVKADDYVDFSGDQNVSVSKDAKDGVKTVKVELNKDLVGIESVSNDGASLILNGTATELTNGKGAAITLFGDTTTINNKVTVYKDGRISGVAAGIRDTDAVNVSQLKAVGTTANMGWNLATNGVATEATNVKPGDFVDFSGDKNISVSHDGTKVKVELNKDIDVNYVQTNALNAKYNLSVGTANADGTMPFFVNSTGAFYAANNKFSVDKDGKVTATAGEIGNVVLNNGVFYKNSALRDGELFIGDADGNYSQITPKSAKLGQVTIDEKGNIAGVNSIQTNALNAKYNLSVGTANENGTVPFFVNSNGAFYGANGSFVVDKDGKVTATAGEIGNVVLQNGVYTGHSALRDGELFVGDASGNYSQITTKGAKLGKVTVAEDGKITGVSAGAITADSTDAVNGSQLHAVATEAGKHSKVVNGSNINVEEFDNDGQKIYKVNLNKDIMLGDLTGKYVNISGTNGTIETTGYIATNDRVYADKGAKLADIDVTGDKISNGASSIVLDGSNVKVNDKVTIDQNGKISGVAAGEISSTSTDAINGSQLHQTNENVAANRADIDKNKADIAALDNRVTQNEADIAANRADIDKNKADIAANRTDIDKNAADIAQNKTDIKNLDNRVTNVEELAKKHTTVTQGDNITVTEGLNADGGKEYNVALDKDINLDSVTTGQTVMNNDGLKVGKDVSVTATAVTAGQTSISNDGLKVNGKTYVSDSGLNANDQKITKVADGDISETSKDAVNGSQLYKTNQEVANNATNISSLSHSISNLDNRVNKVGAGAAALAALHPLDFDPDAKWDFAAGYGNYRGANAAAVGAYYRPNEDTMFSVGGTFGNGENMVNAGVSFKLGSGSSHVSTSRVAMAKEIKELRGELEAMKSAMLDANAGKKIDTSKLQLFPDVPQNHWAYEYVAQLAGNGMIEGYPDGNFAGDRPMTRYEFAAILYRAMTKGAVLSDKILSEFSHELEYFTVDTIAKDKAGNPTIQRVRTVKENKNK